MSTPVTAYRPLTDMERRLLLHLLKPAFPGRDALLAQVASLMACPIDENGSLKFHRPAGKGPPHSLLPSEGQAPDADGMTIHYLLFAVAGELDMLEVYKDDSSPVVKHPAPEDVEVLA